MKMGRDSLHIRSMPGYGWQGKGASTKSNVYSDGSLDRKGAV